MKHKLKLLIIIMVVFILLLSGCGNIEFNIEDTIKPPLAQNAAVQGTWRIEKYISVQKELKDSNQNKNLQDLYVGKNAIFDSEIGAIGTEACTDPSYKIIRTTADTFIQNKYRINEELLGLSSAKIDVVDITSDNQLFYQLIVPDENTAYVYTQDGFLEMKKVSDSVDPKIKQICKGYVGANMENGEYKEDPLLRSGVLIGIRSEENIYSTYWIYSKNRKVKAASSRKQLLVPRSKGFWEIGAVRTNSDIESIYVKPFIDIESQQKSQIISKIDMLNKQADTKILFVGNDYIGIESNFRYNVVPVDGIKEGRGIALSDIMNQNMFSTLKKSRDAFIAALDKDKADKLIKDVNEENYSLKRRNGHWVMTSRLYYKEPNSNKYEDFDLNLMVPSKLIHYDEMNIPWNDIKSRLPWITDAYMSPNKDIAILVSEDSLNIYPVQNSGIVNKQLLKIPLLKTDSIVMTEWSIGKYADIWSEFVQKIFTDLRNTKVNY